jgi:hypothetical protein
MHRILNRPARTGQAPKVTRSMPGARELAARVNDGIHVLLLWHPADDAVTVSVADDRTGERFELPVAPDRALDAFYHPFAYCP